MSKNKLLWMDLEMTGLNENQDQILEIAASITDYDLSPITQAGDNEKQYIVYQPHSVLDGMNDWCKEQHGKSGLTALVPTGRPLAEIETELCDWVRVHFGEKKGKDGAVLAGNSIHNDRRFIDRYLPKLSQLLHYRMVDVSSFKEVFRERYAVKYDKKNTHRAIDDVRESISELAHYCTFIKK